MTVVPIQKSTTVQFRSRVLLSLARVAFGAAERWAPRLGSRLALRLWCTVPRGRRGARARELPAADGQLPAGGRRAVAIPNGRQVLTRTWGRGPIVYLVHGWGGRAGHLAPFVPALVDAGYQAVAFDMPGHGESAPGALGRGRSTLPEFAETLTAVVGAHGPAHGVVAHSLGGSAAALAVLDGLAVQRLVLIAAVADPIAYIPDFARTLGFGERIQANLVPRMEALTRRPRSAFDLPARARDAVADPLPRLLLVHDRQDKEVRYADAPGFAAAWPDGELLSTHGLGHRRILRSGEVIEHTVTFLAQP